MNHFTLSQPRFPMPLYRFPQMIPTPVDTYNQFMAAQNIAQGSNDFQGRPEAEIEFVKHNGCKTLPPPSDWRGPRPSSSCELFIHNVPKGSEDMQFIRPFLRFGRIYEARLPTNFRQVNRGYAYVIYCNEEDAERAFEIMQHFYLPSGQKYKISYTHEKCRLYAGNLPRHASVDQIQSELKRVFPTVQRVVVKTVVNSNSPEKMKTENPRNFVNKGFAFLHFKSHKDAVEAKRSSNPGIIRLLGRDIRIVWANNTNKDSPNDNKTLFVRNISEYATKRDLMSLLCLVVDRTTVRKMSQANNSVFIDFTKREAAEECLNKLQGIQFFDKTLFVEWARFSEKQCLQRLNDTDFDALLRLKCIANYWHIPIILFGLYYEEEHLQYAVIILRNDQNTCRALYFMIHTENLIDIHSRLCEAACAVLETLGCFPDYNYLFYVENDFAHLFGVVMPLCGDAKIIATQNVPNKFWIDIDEIRDLSLAIFKLEVWSEKNVLKYYHLSFREQYIHSFLRDITIGKTRTFGAILPKYRNNPPLSHDLNDTQVVLALCHADTGCNKYFRDLNHTRVPISNFDIGSHNLCYVCIKLLPMEWVQAPELIEGNYKLDHVCYNSVNLYHPEQRIFLPPVFVNGTSYQDTLKRVDERMSLAIEYSYAKNDDVLYFQPFSTYLIPRLTLDSLLMPPNDENNEFLTTNSRLNQQLLKQGLLQEL